MQPLLAVPSNEVHPFTQMKNSYGLTMPSSMTKPTRANNEKDGGTQLKLLGFLGGQNAINQTGICPGHWGQHRPFC